MIDHSRMRFIYACERCKGKAELGPAGGKIDWGCDGPKSCAMKVTKTVDGEAEWTKTMAEIMGIEGS